MIIKTEADRSEALQLIANLNLDKPQQMELKPYSGKRSNLSNDLQQKWFRELVPQLGLTYDEVRAHCKLHYAVPILRQTNAKFKELYDRLIRPIDYVDKLTLMMPPIDLPVTSQMNSKEFSVYMSALQLDMTGNGHHLTIPAGKGMDEYPEVKK